jgi:hypothetical protein
VHVAPQLLADALIVARMERKEVLSLLALENPLASRGARRRSGSWQGFSRCLPHEVLAKELDHIDRLFVTDLPLPSHL